MSMAELPSGTVTFLLTDVEGSTALWEEAPDAMRTALARHDVLFEQAVREHGGVHIRPRDARRNNVPSPPTALLGRERELADVRRLFEDGARLVTLTGPGGTGKTRLGLQVAADLLGDFGHGVFLVDLAPISDPALVPST